MDNELWEGAIERHMRSMMTKKGLNFPKLTELFIAHGFEETQVSLRNKIGRGKFSFSFYLQFMYVCGYDLMEAYSLNTDELDIVLKKRL